MLVHLNDLSKIPFANFKSDYPKFYIKKGDYVSEKLQIIYTETSLDSEYFDVSIKANNVISKEFIDIILDNFDTASQTFIERNLYVQCDIDCVKNILHKGFKVLYHLALDNLCIEEALLTLYLDESNHGINVAILASLIAIKSERFDFQSIINIVVGALLHDMCCDIPYPRDLNKVSIEEYLRMLEHPVKAYDKIKNIEGLSESSKKLVLMHHVWLQPELSYVGDRKHSYPDSYEGKVFLNSIRDVSVGIIQVADDYDYKINSNILDQPNCKKEVMEEIYKNRFLKYGAAAEIFYFNFSPYRIGENVILSNNRQATIVKYTGTIDKPVVSMKRLFFNSSFEVDLTKTKLSISKEVL